MVFFRMDVKNTDKESNSIFKISNSKRGIKKKPQEFQKRKLGVVKQLLQTVENFRGTIKSPVNSN